MRIRGEQLRKLAAGVGLSAEQLGAAVERPGLSGPDAKRAVGNWMAGREQPRCKPTDAAKLAEALRVSVKDFVKFTTQVRAHRGSPRKARLLTDLVKGKGVIEAENLLRFTPKRAAVDVRKALAAAVADAQQFEADEGKLVISESRVDAGPVLKRFQPKDRGRAHPILKPFSHITISVEERP